MTDCNSSPSAKKQKRTQKRPSMPGKTEKNGAGKSHLTAAAAMFLVCSSEAAIFYIPPRHPSGHSSDSEDQSRLSSLSKSQKSRCPGLSSPSSHSKDKQSFPSPQRTYKWTFQLGKRRRHHAASSSCVGKKITSSSSSSSDELDSMSSTERISFLQDKLQEIRKYYMTLKSEVASIDRRRKRLKKKEREGGSCKACWENACCEV